ncbi:MAG: hypothetical protein IJI06_09760 [Oscillospiraceae bacterium]|nr:hypothetical protein [Oscillospiraceae bacterium]
MTRKRFKKLCMSLGFSRSMADLAAFTAWFVFGNYADGWCGIDAAAVDVKRARDAENGEEAAKCE